MCLLDANNLRDFEQDAKNNKKTIVVRFGEAFGKKVYIFSLIMSLALVPIFCYYELLPLLSLAVFVLTPKAKKNIEFCKTHSGAQIIPLLQMTAQYKILYGIILSLSMLL